MSRGKVALWKSNSRPAEDFRRDFDLFAEGVRNPEAEQRIRAAFEHGLQTRAAETSLTGCWAT